MPRINTTPSVRTFTETWTADFRTAVTKAAGANGKLSTAEAKALASSPDAVFADTVLQTLKASGKTSDTVENLVAAAKAYAQRAAEVAAGHDKRLSLEDGAKLSPDLVEDFFMLRGKSVPAGVLPRSSMAAIDKKVTTAVAGMWMPSESDAKMLFLRGPQLNGAKLTPALIRSAFQARHDAVMPDLMNSGQVPLQAEVETKDGSAFLQHIIDGADPNDPVSQDAARRFAHLKTVLESELTDLTVYRFGHNTLSTFIVGRTKAGELAGLLTGQVET